MASTANCSKKFSSDNGGKWKSKKFLPAYHSLHTGNLCHLIHSGWESITISVSQEYIPWETLFYQPYLQCIKTKLPRDKCAPNWTQKHLDQPFRKWLYSSLVTINIRCSLLQCTNEYTEGGKPVCPLNGSVREPGTKVQDKRFWLWKRLPGAQRKPCAGRCPGAWSAL